MYSRRRLIQVAAAAASFGPWVVRPQALSSSGELHLMLWSNYLPTPLQDKFTAATGIDLTVSSYGSNSELLHRFSAGGEQPVDLICPTHDQSFLWKDLDSLGYFDLSRIPTERLEPAIMAISESFSWDSEPRHLPYLWGAEALAWRTDRWEQRYEELSLGDLWQPTMRGRIMGHPYTMMVGIGRWMEATGELPPFIDSYRSEEQMRRHWDTITTFALARKPWIRTFWNDADGQIDGFMQNSVILGQTWDSPPLKLFRDGEPVVFMAPQEGAFAWLDGLALPRKAENIDAVYAFIDFIYDPINAGTLANGVGCNTGVIGAERYLAAPVREGFQQAYPEDALERLWPWPATPAWYKKISAEYQQRFVSG